LFFWRFWFVGLKIIWQPWNPQVLSGNYINTFETGIPTLWLRTGLRGLPKTWCQKSVGGWHDLEVWFFEAEKIMKNISSYLLTRCYLSFFTLAIVQAQELILQYGVVVG
jgi:hypothetical protein